MISFKQYIIEGRDAPLYHGTETMANAFFILNDNMMKAIGNHSGVQKQSVISLTRDKRFALNWMDGGIALELNQRKLSQKYKIRPIDIENIWNQKYGAARMHRGRLYEEYIEGDIKNIDRYLERIIVESPTKLEKLEKSFAMLNDRNRDNILDNFGYLPIYVNSTRKTHNLKDIL